MNDECDRIQMQQPCRIRFRYPLRNTIKDSGEVEDKSQENSDDIAEVIEIDAEVQNDTRTAESNDDQC